MREAPSRFETCKRDARGKEGPDRATFVGSFTGMVFVETDKGPLDAGFMICPAIVSLRAVSRERNPRCIATIEVAIARAMTAAKAAKTGRILVMAPTMARR